MKKLLELGADPNLRSGDNNNTTTTTPFLTACSLARGIRNNYYILSLLIKFGADVNSTLDTGIFKTTALAIVCEGQDLKEVKLLVDNGANLRESSRDGPQSIICSADINPNLDIKRYLLIEKNVSIPDYCYIRNEGLPQQEKITLQRLLIERPESMDSNQIAIRNEILSFLEKKEK